MGPPPLPTDLPPAVAPAEPSPVLLGVAVVNLVAAVTLLALLWAELTYPQTPFAFMGVVCFMPSLAVVAWAQFLAVFRRNTSAAGLAAALYLTGAALFGFAAAADLVELIKSDDPAPAGNAGVIATLAALAAYGAFAGALHLRWWRDLRRPPPTHLCRACAYDLTGNVSGICPECGTPLTPGAGGGGDGGLGPLAE